MQQRRELKYGKNVGWNATSRFNIPQLQSKTDKHAKRRGRRG